MILATALGGVLGAGAGWVVGFATADWSMQGYAQVRRCVAQGAAIGAACGVAVGLRYVRRHP